MNILRFSADDPHYPRAVKIHLAGDAPSSLAALGNLDLLYHKTLAFFCSVRCSGAIILKTYDLAQNLREQGVTVIGGFHSPMERECLNILLRGTQPIVICPARSVERMRVREEYKKPLERGRLLVLSPFGERQRRVTEETSIQRNRLVAATADAMLVTYAEPRGKMEQLCREVVAWGKPLYTLADDANARLIALGAKPVQPNSVAQWISNPSPPNLSPQ